MPRLSSAAGSQRSPAAAFDGENYLLVWTDSQGGLFRVMAARLDTAGALIDSLGILISSDGIDPAVASNGRDFLVVWTRDRSGTRDIYSARVSPEGEVLDPGGRAISTAISAQAKPQVASNGTGYMVVWEDFRRGFPSDIYGARVGYSGIVHDPDGIPISTSENAQASPAISYDGENYVVVWEDSRASSWSKHIYAARLNSHGDNLDPGGTAVSTSGSWETDPAVCSGAGYSLVVWRDGTLSDTSRDLLGARLDRSGAVLGPGAVPISTESDDFGSPAVGYDGEGFLAVWNGELMGGEDILGARIDTAGSQLDPVEIRICTDASTQIQPAVAFDGNNYTVFWNDQRDGTADIRCARVRPFGLVLDRPGRLLTLSADNQGLPAVCFNGESYLIAWENTRNGVSEIRGSRVDQSGRLLDDGSLSISSGDRDRTSPAVASDGEDHLVVWEDRRAPSPGVYGARVGPTGSVMDPGGIAIATDGISESYPDAAFDGTNYMVVWMEFDGLIDRIHGALVSPDGEVIAPGQFLVSAGPGHHMYPAIGFDGTKFLVAWISREGQGDDIYGTRVTTTGSVLDPDPIPISVAEDEQRYPEVASDGESFLVVWEDRRGDDSDIHCARIDESGTVLDPQSIQISAGPDWDMNPAVEFDGESYVVVWYDFNGGDTEVYGARLAPNGEALDPDAVVMLSTPHRQYSPALASGNFCQSLIVCASAVPDKPYRSNRIFANFLDLPPDGSPVRLTLAPNPMQATVRAAFRLPAAGRIRLDVFDPAGRLVRTVATGYRGPGWSHESWDGRDDEGRAVPAGVYLLRMRCSYGEVAEKCVLVK